MGEGRRLARAMAIAVAVPLLLAAPAHAGDTDLVRRIFTALDLRGEIEGVAPSAAARLGGFADAPASDRRLLRWIVETGFAPVALERLTLAAFMERFDLAHARAAAEWLARPEIERLHAAGRMQPPACELRASDHTGARGRALARIVTATSVDAHARRNAAFVLGAMLEVASQALPETQRPTRGELDTLLRANEPETAPAPADACRYRSFSTDELVAAEAFVDSEAGRWLYGSVGAAVEQALTRAARATALRIVDTFGDADGRDVPLRIALAEPPPG